MTTKLLLGVLLLMGASQACAFSIGETVENYVEGTRAYQTLAKGYRRQAHGFSNETLIGQLNTYWFGFTPYHISEEVFARALSSPEQAGDLLAVFANEVKKNDFRTEYTAQVFARFLLIYEQHPRTQDMPYLIELAHGISYDFSRRYHLKEQLLNQARSLAGEPASISEYREWFQLPDLEKKWPEMMRNLLPIATAADLPALIKISDALALSPSYLEGQNVRLALLQTMWQLDSHATTRYVEDRILHSPDDPSQLERFRIDFTFAFQYMPDNQFPEARQKIRQLLDKAKSEHSDFELPSHEAVAR